MKLLLLACALLLSSSAIAEPIQHLPIQKIKVMSQDTREEISTMCAKLLIKDVSFQQVVDALKLSTKDEQEGFVNLCGIYFQGMKDGIVATQQKYSNHTTEALKL